MFAFVFVCMCFCKNVFSRLLIEKDDIWMGENLTFLSLMNKTLSSPHTKQVGQLLHSVFTSLLPLPLYHVLGGNLMFTMDEPARASVSHDAGLKVVESAESSEGACIGGVTAEIDRDESRTRR